MYIFIYRTNKGFVNRFIAINNNEQNDKHNKKGEKNKKKNNGKKI